MTLARFLRFVLLVVVVVAASLTAPGLAAAGGSGGGGGWGGGGGRQPDLGPNVKIFDPTMSTSQIQAEVDKIAAQQVPAEFGPGRYALLFKPGTYGSTAQPLNFKVGYYTSVAGLGRLPGDVTINGSIDVENQCDENGKCISLNNFWRSMSNLTVNVSKPADLGGCESSAMFWAVSQAAPLRRVQVNGSFSLMAYCKVPAWASGGFIADSKFDGTVINGSQQQWITRNSEVGHWGGGVWNQVFSGVTGAPEQCFPAVPGDGGCGPYTTLNTSPITKEAPVLSFDGRRNQVFVPALRSESSGTSWGQGVPKGTTIPLDRFYVAKAGDSAQKINSALAKGQHLLLTPGIYPLNEAIKVTRANTVVLGLGYATLIPQRGNAALTVGDVPGVDIAGVTIDAGPKNSQVLMQVGTKHGRPCGGESNPTVLHDVFFRIGGAAAGRATLSLEVNSDHTILDNIWAWRADHGKGVGWDVNTADTGVIVNGDDVTAYGLFVEHYQKTQTIWNGNGGRVIFFQNEMPYDPPNQDAWKQRSGALGYPALKVSDKVRTFSGTGMGSYSFFSKAYNGGKDIVADNAFEVPAGLAPRSVTNLLTVFLDPGNGTGGINNVINGTGGSSTIDNPATAVTVVEYPLPPGGAGS